MRTRGGCGVGGNLPQRADEEDAVHPQVLQGRIPGGPHRERGAGHDDRDPRHGDLQNRKLKFPDTGQWRQFDVKFASITSRRVDANLSFFGGVGGVWRQGTLTSIDANLTR